MDDDDSSDRKGKAGNPKAGDSDAAAKAIRPAATGSSRVGSSAIQSALTGAGAVAGAVAAATSSKSLDLASVGDALSTGASTLKTFDKAVDVVNDVMEKIADFFDGESAGVRYRFICHGGQYSEWKVRTLELREGLSTPYKLELELVTDDVTAEPTELLGRACTLEIERGTRSLRRVHGIVAEVRRGGTGQRQKTAQIEVVPALQALARRSDTRVFQAKTVPQILTEVLESGLAPYARKLRCELRRQEYPTREYTVQYRESHLAFAQRLMADEGIFFYFDHEGDEAEVLVLVDANKTCPAGDPKQVEIILEQAGLGEDESISVFALKTQLVSTSLWVADYDWTAPTTEVKTVLPGEGDELGDRPEYQPSGVTLHDYSVDGRVFRKRDVADQARLGRERQLVIENEATGKSNVTSLAAGRRVELVGHPDGALDNEYLLTSVHHRGAGQREGGTGSDLQDYENDFACIPAATPFRPSSSAVPRIHGVQTATVVGPNPAEEIHTDEFGRIQVRFHWARKADGSATTAAEHSTADARATCFVRVAQAWAGHGWGFQFLPRIGMEVMVTFLDGDPDRPLVTGCVYNGEHHPPYPPNEKTKSTIKTQSSPGGDGYNELRFEDAKGKEEIFLHAEKDLNEVVDHNHSTTVHANQTNSVDGSRSVTVHGKQTHTVDKDRSVTVHGEQTHTVDKDRSVTVHGKQTHTVDKDRSVTVHGEQTHTVDKDRSVTVHGSESHLVDKDRALTVVGKQVVVVGVGVCPDGDATNLVFVEGSHSLKASTTIEVTAGDSITLTCGDSKLIMTPTTITLAVGAATVEIDKDNISISAPKGMTATGGATVEIKGGSSSVLGDAGGVTVKGASVKLN